MDNKKYIVLFLKRNDQDTLDVKPSQTFSDRPSANEFLKKKNECGEIFDCPSGKQPEKTLLQRHQQQLINRYKDKFEQAEAERKNETSPGMSKSVTDDNTQESTHLTNDVVSSSEESQDIPSDILCSDPADSTCNTESTGKPGKSETPAVSEDEVYIGFRYKGSKKSGNGILMTRAKLTQAIQKAADENRIVKCEHEPDEDFRKRSSNLSYLYSSEDKAKCELGIQKRSSTNDFGSGSDYEKHTSSQEKTASHTSQPTSFDKLQHDTQMGSTPPCGHQKSSQTIYPDEKSLAELHSNLKQIKSQFDRIEGSLVELKRQISGNSKVNQITQTLADYDYYFKSITQEVRAASEMVQKKTRQIEETVSDSMEPLRMQLNEAITSTETMQGKLTAVEEKLSAKGVRITREANPTNADAKVIANAKTLAIRLIESLSDAATAYANNKDAIEDAAESEAKREAEIEGRIEEARIAGRKDVLMEILEKYEDLDSMLDDPNNNILVGLLKNNGLEQDEQLKKGARVTIRDEQDVQKVGAVAKGVTVVGEYTVERSLFRFNGKTYDAVIKLITSDSNNIPSNSDASATVVE